MKAKKELQELHNLAANLNGGMMYLNKDSNVGQNLRCVEGAIGNAMRITRRLIKSAEKRLTPNQRTG